MYKKGCRLLESIDLIAPFPPLVRWGTTGRRVGPPQIKNPCSPWCQCLLECDQFLELHIAPCSLSCFFFFSLDKKNLPSHTNGHPGNPLTKHKE